MKIADLYIRVSTDEQADKGYSQRDQEERLSKYCAINGISVRKKVFEDHSAKTFERPAWISLLRDIKRHKGQTDLVLFTKWDRFSRNAGDAYHMISTLRKLSVEPQAIEQPLDISIPENKMMLAFYLAAPEVENDRRALNVFHGMRRARKEGRHMSAAPIGYRNKTSDSGQKLIAPKEPQASAMQWAFQEIAKKIFNSEQIWKMAKTKGLTCGKNNFYNAIRNPLYCGKILVPAYKDEPATIVNGQHEGIISEDLFYTVQDVLDGRKRTTRAQIEVDGNLALRGFLICPECGRTLTGSRSKGRNQYYYYYHCISPCGFRHRAEEVNKLILKEIKKHVKPLPKIQLYLQIITDIFKSKTIAQREDIKSVKTQLEKANQKLVRARDLLLEGDITGDEYRSIKAECEKAIARLEAKLAASAHQRHNITELLDRSITSLANLDELYENGTIQQKRRIIGSIFPKKLIFDGKNYRTAHINEAVRLISLIDKKLYKIKNWTNHDKSDLSSMVGPTGFEPVTPCL
tara:strand:+ start:25757 stop:27310 length:1554 start_codon:yes stop_codon:yes gene_type:complete